MKRERWKFAAITDSWRIFALFLPMVMSAGIAATTVPAWAQNADELAKQYTKEAMQQALETRQRYDVYGIHFDTDLATIQPGGEVLLDDIATALQNFPEWRLRIVGHTDATGDPAANQTLSLERAGAVKAALVQRGVDPARVQTGGVGEMQPIASNSTADGRSLNRRVELTRTTDSAEAKRLLKAMSDYLAAQEAISFEYDSTLEVVTNDDQKLALANSGAITLNRPDHIRSSRTGGFVDLEVDFDGKVLTLFGKNLNKYTQVAAPGTVDQLIDDLKDKHGLPLPGADLLMTDPYGELMSDVYDSKDLGSGVINGVECDWLAFRKDEVDFQIWVAQGTQPYPCRMVVTSTSVAGGPQYSVQIRDWKTGDAAMMTDFTFNNTTNAEMVDVNDLRNKLSELPDHFKVGDRQ